MGEDVMTQREAVVDLETITARGKEVWSSGDFNVVARQTMAVAEEICRAVDPRPGQKVLDVACGSGNVALVAARRYCDVAGVDFAPNLIESATARAAAEGSEIDFQVGDAQALPFPDASFDVVFSVFGVMFAPDQERAARELLRVCRPGGVIALASWMPEAFGKDFFGAHAKHAPPPAGAPSPMRWGTEAGLRELFGDAVRSMRNTRKSSFAYYRSIEHALDVFREYFGPSIRAYGMVGPEGAEALRADLTAVFERYNRATDGTLVKETEYLETIAIRV
jgi:ubiquinone/menaquinone biosynthesis C-methylase UbiE